MTVTKFERVQLAATKSVPCTGCGKKVRRQRTFEQMLNPFNKNADGTVKEFADIWRELEAEADEWKVQPQDIAELVLDLLAMPDRTLPSRIEVRPSRPPRG